MRYKKIFFMLIFSFTTCITAMQESSPDFEEFTVVLSSTENILHQNINLHQQEFFKATNQTYQAIAHSLTLEQSEHLAKIRQHLRDKNMTEEQMIDYLQNDCVTAIKLFDYPAFKTRLDALKIFNALHCKNDENYFEYYQKRIGIGDDRDHYRKQSILTLACRINPKYGIIRRNPLNPKRFETVAHFNFTEKESAKKAIIQELINSQTNLNAKNILEETALHQIIHELDTTQILKSSSWVIRPLYKEAIAYQKNHYREIVTMLVKAGANINEKSSGINKYSPLSLAVEHENLIAMEILLELGAGQDEIFWIDSTKINKYFRKKLPYFVKNIERTNENMICISLQPKIKIPSHCSIS